MNTWERLKLTACGKKHLKENTHRKLNEGTSTRTKTKNYHMGTLCNDINRRIDYIAINRRYRNCIRHAQTITGWKANMQQDKKHNVIIMHICIKLMKNSRNSKPETGGEITYTAQYLNLYPEKLPTHGAKRTCA